MNFKKLIAACFFVFTFSFLYASDGSILYISDNIRLNDDFDQKYIDMLQEFINDNKRNKIQIKKFLGFDINTTESIELFDMFNKDSIPKALILMVGESNYHNLYGFSKYMNNRNRVQNITNKNRKNLYEINSEMNRVYASFKENFAKQVFGTAYKSVISSSAKKTFTPKVIPNFYALNKDFKKDNNIVAAVESYRHAWTLIRAKEFDKAKSFLQNLIEKKSSQSMFYYALSCVYLMENKEENCELKALKLLEEGILVDPLNKENVCYKGLMFLFMMYKGEITSEILYFSRALNNCFLNISDEISAITAINTPDHKKKIEIIDDWILFDIDEIKRKCYNMKVPLIFASYPDDLKINSLIYKHVQNSSNTTYIDNKTGKDEDKDFFIYRIAKKMYEFLRKNKIIE